MTDINELIEQLYERIDSMERKILDKIDSEISFEGHRLRDIDWVSEYCGVHPNTIRYRIRNQNFPFYKSDSNKSDLKFRKFEVDKWIEQNMKI